MAPQMSYHVNDALKISNPSFAAWSQQAKRFPGPPLPGDHHHQEDSQDPRAEMGHQVQVHVKGCDWTIVNPNNNNKKEAHIAFTLEVETLAGSFSTCGTKKIVTRWSAVQTLDNDLIKPKMRFPHAPGYTKEMGNILARGTCLTFWRGSCLKATVAKARLGVIADYLQAVLQEPELRTNVHVQYFLRQAELDAPSVESITTSSCDRHRQPTPTTTTSASQPIIITAAAQPQLSTTDHVQSTATTAHVHPRPPSSNNNNSDTKTIFQVLKRFSPTHNVQAPCLQKTTTAGTVLGCPSLSLREETARRAIKILLFDSLLLGPHLSSRCLWNLSMASKEWSSAVQQVTALTPRAAGAPCSRWQGVVNQKLNGVRGLLQDSVRHPLSATSLRKHARDRDLQQAEWNSFIKALQENKMPSMQHLDLGMRPKGIRWLPHLWRPRLTYEPLSVMAASFRNMPNLQDLSLRKTQIGTQGAIALVEGLSHTPSLRLLDISYTKLGDEGMSILAPALATLPKLEALFVYDCGMEFLGSTFLAQNLQYMPQLKTFGFSMPFACTGPVIDQLHALTELRCLHIENGIHDYEAAKLSDKLPLLPKLQYLLSL